MPFLIAFPGSVIEQGFFFALPLGVVNKGAFIYGEKNDK